MKEITELKIVVRHLDSVMVEGIARSGILSSIAVPTVVLHTAVTDRLVISDEAVRVLRVGR